MSRHTSFATRLQARESLTGTFQKTPHHHVTEVLGLSGLHFIVLDAEHSTFDTTQLDTCVLAARAADLPCLVRIAGKAPEAVLKALDMGATGVFVPHVVSADDAKAVAESAHCLSGTRGFSPSTRAGGYGTRGLTPYMEQADREVTVILQIEDAQAFPSLDVIAATPGVSGLFVGRADLAASMKLAWDDPRLDEATRSVAEACAKAGIACGAYLADERRHAEFSRWGVSFFVVGSDQGALRAEVSRVATAFKSSVDPPSR